eukprot:gb/GECG01000430.1/.p1 GENE.gb/GECG01000430.1/~~gb/GECG01000430.1/.p1  ORF type:complete len:160 (+),score=19.17 gb/GECG01000430.1/:1-480(+)
MELDKVVTCVTLPLTQGDVHQRQADTSAGTMMRTAKEIEVNENDFNPDEHDYPYPLCKTRVQFFSFMHNFLNNVEVVSLGKSEDNKIYHFEAKWTSNVFKRVYGARSIKFKPEDAAFHTLVPSVSNFMYYGAYSCFAPWISDCVQLLFRVVPPNVNKEN